MDKATLQQTALQLSPDDRLELAETLWASVDYQALAVPAWHLPLIDEAIAEADAHPEQSVSWKEARQRIRRRIRSESPATAG